jgi:hypothetical protein
MMSSRCIRCENLSQLLLQAISAATEGEGEARGSYEKDTDEFLTSPTFRVANSERRQRQGLLEQRLGFCEQ